MLVIQIIRVEIKEENIVHVNLKKGEGRKKDFIFQNQKIERKEEDSLWDRFTHGITPPNLSDMIPKDTGYIPIYQSKYLTLLY